MAITNCLSKVLTDLYVSLLKNVYYANAECLGRCIDRGMANVSTAGVFCSLVYPLVYLA